MWKKIEHLTLKMLEERYTTFTLLNKHDILGLKIINPNEDLLKKEEE